VKEFRGVMSERAEEMLGVRPDAGDPVRPRPLRARRKWAK